MMGNEKVEMPDNLIGCPILAKLMQHGGLEIRLILAEVGYGLEVLAHDEKKCVRDTVSRYLENNQVIDYKAECEKRCCENGLCSCVAMNKLINCKTTYIRSLLASYGCAPDVFIKDKRVAVRLNVLETGYGWKTLLKDKDRNIRIALAQKKYRLDILINDKDSMDCSAGAEMKYGMEILINDKEPEVREAVARQGYKLDILINAPCPTVRAEVALQGYGLEKLINDPSKTVQNAALEYWQRERKKIMGELEKT